MSSDSSPSVLSFDDLLSDTFVNYVSYSAKIGASVKTHSDMVLKAIKIHRQFLITASMSKKPNDSTLISLLKPMSDIVQKIQEFRENNKTNEYFNHLSAISESIPALGWITISPTPVPFVKEMVDISQYFVNKVLVNYKEKDKTHVEWAKAWLSFLRDLRAYIIQYHTTGLTWNQRGVDISCAQLNETVSVVSAPSPPPPPRAPVVSQKKPKTRVPSKVTLNGKKWMVENLIGEKNLIISDTQMNQSINVYKCEDCVLTVKGKINSITVDLSKRFSIVFENIVSVVEFINCQRIQVQAEGVVPTITINKVDDIELYLAEESLKCEIVSSKSSGINISVPDPNTEDYVEHPIPEQFRTIWTGEGFKTEALKSA